MRKRLHKMKRDFLVGRVIVVGRKLRRYQVARAGVDARMWPEDCAFLDSVIDVLERRHRRLLNQLKEG